MDTSPDQAAIASAKETIDEIIKTEEPIKVPLTNPFMANRDFSQIMRKAARENKRMMHDLNAKENFKFCRKRCPNFKRCECFKKSFEDQNKCYESGEYKNVQPNKEEK